MAVLAILASALIALPAQAAPPLPDAGIWVAGDATARAAVPEIAYGDRVSFDWMLEGKVAKNHYLTIMVRCEQDGAMIYTSYGQPDFAFRLADQNASQWTWDHGDADCTASLRYFANNRLSIVATTPFAVAGEA